MKAVRTLLVLASVLSANAVAAEAGKGFSHISQGTILWLIFFFGFCLPGALGLATFALLNLRRNAKPNLFFTILAALSGWWLGLAWSFRQGGGDFSWAWLLIGALLPAAFVAYVTGDDAISSHPTSQDEDNEQ